MKYLLLWFDRGFNSKEIPCLINLLKLSKIQFLDLLNIKSINGLDSPQFCDFLKNTEYLRGLRLHNSKENDFNCSVILQALSLNKSIKILSFAKMNLFNFSSDFLNLLSSNKTISTLEIENCRGFKINIEFIETVQKNKTLLFLILYKIQIEEQIASKLTELNLKGINIDAAEISTKGKDFIYSKIPRIEYFFDLMGYEKFLK